MIYEPIINRVTVRVKMLFRPRTNNATDTFCRWHDITNTLITFLFLYTRNRKGKKKKKEKGKNDHFSATTRFFLKKQRRRRKYRISSTLHSIPEDPSCSWKIRETRVLYHNDAPRNALVVHPSSDSPKSRSRDSPEDLERIYIPPPGYFCRHTLSREAWNGTWTVTGISQRLESGEKGSRWDAIPRNEDVCRGLSALSNVWGGQRHTYGREIFLKWKNWAEIT